MKEKKDQCEDDLFDMDELLNRTKKLNLVKMVVVAPYDEATLRSVAIAKDEEIVTPILVGEKKKILKSAERFGISLKSLKVVNTSKEDVIEKSASYILNKEASFIMKGLVGTGKLLHVLLDAKYKIRTDRILSHVGMFEIPDTKRIFLVSDVAINILPNFTRKIYIVSNACDVARKIGIKKPRVAMLAAVEKVNLPAMPATLDAFLMKKFSKTNCFGDCEIGGPFALDNAIDPAKAAMKGIGGEVAGRANILVVPNIETGNAIYKSITCIQKGKAAGVVVGGNCPIVVSSRSDDYKVKLSSIKFARFLMRSGF